MKTLQKFLSLLLFLALFVSVTALKAKAVEANEETAFEGTVFQSEEITEPGYRCISAIEEETTESEGAVFQSEEVTEPGYRCISANEEETTEYEETVFQSEEVTQASFRCISAMAYEETETSEEVAEEVTEAPTQYGNLQITKEITSDHAVPQSVMDTVFEVNVNLGASMAGEMVTMSNSQRQSLYGVMLDEEGSMTIRLKANQTVRLLRLPAGTEVAITEPDPGSDFETTEGDNVLVVPPEGDAIAVVTKRYTPNVVSDTQETAEESRQETSQTTRTAPDLSNPNTNPPTDDPVDLLLLTALLLLSSGALIAVLAGRKEAA